MSRSTWRCCGSGALGEHATVVDLGAGTGRFALTAASHCGRVVAVDIAPAMVEHLRRAAGDPPAVEVVRAGFLSYEHAGPAADAVYSRHATPPRTTLPTSARSSAPTANSWIA